MYNKRFCILRSDDTEFQLHRYRELLNKFQNLINCSQYNLLHEVLVLFADATVAWKKNGKPDDTYNVKQFTQACDDVSNWLKRNYTDKIFSDIGDEKNEPIIEQFQVRTLKRMYLSSKHSQMIL